MKPLRRVAGFKRPRVAVPLGVAFGWVGVFIFLNDDLRVSPSNPTLWVFPMGKSRVNPLENLLPFRPGFEPRDLPALRALARPTRGCPVGCHGHPESPQKGAILRHPDRGSW